MAFQRVPDTALIRMVFRNINREVSNLYYARQVGGYNQAGLDSLAIGLDAYGPQFAALMSTDDRYIRTDVVGLDVENDVISTANTSAVDGSLTQQPAPSNVSFVVSRRSGFSGRSARGRTYCCGITIGALSQAPYGTENQLTETYANAWLAVIDGVRIAIDNVGTFDPVLVSRYHNNAKRPEAVTFPWVTTIYTTLTLASRRDRLR